ncbi:MAG TPA: penicillin acylase family protein, partial [Acidimicrobiales bacterium]|nr:penicillin acylase family protein [Acidimicrobiales bacterium]
HSGVAASLAQRLLDEATPTLGDARALGLLGGWDGHMDADSPAAALVGTVRAELVRLLCHELGLVHDRLPEVPGPSLHQTLRFVNARMAFWLDDASLVSTDVLTSALRFAVRSLELSQGPVPARWRWGAVHRSRWAHPLLALRPDLAGQLEVPPALELGGDNECVWATSTAPPSTDASNAQVARYVFDVGDWDRSAWVVPHGVSGDSRSPHHLDQLDAWASMQLRPMRYSAAAVDAATESVTELT